MAIETIDSLGINNLKLIQNDETFRFGTDSLVLSRFAKCKKTDRVIDLGTGNGVLSLLIYGFYNPKSITAIDISFEACKLAQKNVDLNGLNNIITIVNTDIKTLKKANFGDTEVVISNPPYFDKNSGYISDKEYLKNARHNFSCSICDVVKAASELLKFGGLFYCVYPADGLCDLFFFMRKNNIEPKELQLFMPTKEKKPSVVFVKGKKGAKPSLNILPPLIQYDENHEYTKEFKEICSFYKKEE